MLGKPARLPAAVNSLARSAECRPAHRNADLHHARGVLLAGARERELRLLGLGGVRSLRPHCGSRGWGRDCRPRGVAPPGRSLRCVWPVCAARLCGQENRQPSVFFGTRGALKRDAVSALDSQVEERTSRSAPNFGCPAATFWNTASTDNSIRMGPSEV